MYKSDTIAAIASGMTASGIGIVRISGPEAFSVLARVFRPAKEADVLAYPTNTIHYGHIVTGEETIDECLVMILRGPRTYTTEDTVEIDCHGGPYVMRQVLNAVLDAGARLAEPGEFTKRAFLGGRIDLSEAEAVMDVISSKSRDALKSSLSQLGGSVRREITHLREMIMDELAFIEAALDDPEHYELDNYGDTLKEHLLPAFESLQILQATYSEGRLIREGILTVILGKPNAGKSSLLNLLCGTDRAIVTEIEGTTRDVLEETVSLGGLTLRIRDTAGIRNARDRVEEIGVGKAKENAADADLILAVFDSSREPDENDLEILSLIRDKNAIVLLNKSDLPPVLTANRLSSLLKSESISNHQDEIGNEHQIPSVLTISARSGEGLDTLEQTIRKMFFSGQLSFNEEVMITNARQKAACDTALQSLNMVFETIRAGLPEDLYAVDLMDAYRSLGEIIGEEVEDDLVNTIFSKFCMGK